MNNINNDATLREAVNRREQHLPPMPADLNERLMQRLQDAERTSPSRSRHIRHYLSIAACILLIIGIGTVMLMNKTVQDEVILAKGTVKPSQDETMSAKETLKSSPLHGSLAPPGRQRASSITASSTSLTSRRELPDTLGDGIWKSERNVVRAIQMLGECEVVIRKNEQEMRNTIVKATFNATPQPANAVLVTNEAGDCEVIETKNIIEI